MEYLTAVWTPVPVSRIGMGCELLGGSDWGAVDLPEAIAAVRRAYDIGVTVFDTADVYGLGRSEEMLAHALGSRLREVIVISKGGIRWEDPPGGGRASTFRDLSPRYLRRAVQNSMRRLRLEQIPLYLAHWPDGRHDVDEVVAALRGLRDEGLIGALGLSNFGFAELEHAEALSGISAVEIEHSLLSPKTPMIDLAQRNGWQAFTYGALGQGLLTGKYDDVSTFPTNDRRHRLEHFTSARVKRKEAMAELRALASEVGTTPAQLAIRWSLQSPGKTCAIVGARSVAQVEENAKAVGPLPSIAARRLLAVSTLLGDV